MGLFIELIVDAERCAGAEGCRECVQVCPVDIFTRIEGEPALVVAANEDECILCDLCVVKCPVEAVTLTKRY